MTHTTHLIARVLALSVEWRWRLSEQVGPGCWVDQDGNTYSVIPGPLEAVWPPRDLVPAGWAWLPADSLAWLRATGAPWACTSNDCRCDWAPPDPDPVWAALFYMERNPAPEARS